jgi:cation diffusion facilitator CzcD-associated flavoprotein CzcO
MPDTLLATAGLGAVRDKAYDAIVIGAGIAGMHQLYRLRELGLSVRVFETGSGVGGTWYWNRYPGARFDSESYTYGYAFSEELLREWSWSEHFAAQPETLRYLNHVADRFDLRRDIQFNSRVVASSVDEAERLWQVTLEGGDSFFARFLITALVRCRPTRCRASRAWTASAASRSTPTSGRTSRSTSRASGSR